MRAPTDVSRYAVLLNCGNWKWAFADEADDPTHAELGGALVGRHMRDEGDARPSTMTDYCTWAVQPAGVP
ncbi:hypothetical protein A6456_33990 [Paraburkholderia tropica]|nr:hypothetical protein A6456_33990 [Paraburkholderia tropica]